MQNDNSKWIYLPQWNVLQLHWPNGNVRYEVDLDRPEMDWVDHLSSKRWMTPALMTSLRSYL